MALNGSNSNEIVFPRKDGRPFIDKEGSSDSPYYFSEAVKILGFNEGKRIRDRVTFHTIRHTVVTKLKKYWMSVDLWM